MTLTRFQFQNKVFERDTGKCVVPGCARRAVDAHHIMERRLFTDGDPNPGGYHLDNGASLCELHHRHAEAGYFPPEALRRWLKIQKPILPAICKADRLHDKWGNLIALAPAGHIKYPKTPYLNFSPGYERGDRFIDTKLLLQKPLVVQIKKDGSCTSLSHDQCVARNGQEARHQSFDFLKQRHATLCSQIPEHLQLFGEWLFAKHSIHYCGELALRDYFELFAVYDQQGQLFLSQDETQALAKQLGLILPEVVASVVYEKEWELVQGLTALANSVIAKGHEGIVVKSSYPYHYTQFAQNVAKYVRVEHVQTTQHWKSQKLVKNDLME